MHLHIGCHAVPIGGKPEYLGIESHRGGIVGGKESHGVESESRLWSHKARKSHIVECIEAMYHSRIIYGEQEEHFAGKFEVPGAIGGNYAAIAHSLSSNVARGIGVIGTTPLLELVDAVAGVLHAVEKPMLSHPRGSIAYCAHRHMALQSLLHHRHHRASLLRSPSVATYEHQCGIVVRCVGKRVVRHHLHSAHRCHGIVRGSHYAIDVFGL